MPTFQVTPLGEADARAIREEIEAGDRPARLVTLDEPGAPCRCCLRGGEVDEEMWLLTFQPFRGESFYTAASPIFLHVEACAPYVGTDQLPELVLTGQRSVRSYDDHHELVDGIVGSGTEIVAAVHELLANDRADYLHIYSATAGCYTCRIERSGQTRG
jgi:hypothetical protein